MKNLILSIIFGIFASVAFANSKQEITIIVPYPPGSTNDRWARPLALDLEKRLDFVVTVKNMPGAANMVAINQVLNNTDKGYSFILTINDFITGPLFQDNNSYAQFQAVNIMGTLPFVVFGDKNSFQDKFKLQIQNHDTVNIGNNGMNGSAELWISSLKSLLNINPIPYKGGNPLISDVRGNQIEYGVMSIAGIYSFVKDGSLNPIMISSDRRSPAMPAVPTYRELGFKGSGATSWTGIFARRDMPKDMVKAVSMAVQESVMTDPLLQDFKNQGVHLINLDYIEAEKFFQNEISYYKKIRENNKNDKL